MVLYYIILYYVSTMVSYVYMISYTSLIYKGRSK